MRRKRARGFSLIELLVASVISTVVMLGLGSIFMTAFNAQAKSLRQARAQIAATQLSKILSKDIYQANYINQPAVNAWGTVLEGYVGIQKIGPGNVWSFTHPLLPSGNPGQTTYNRFLYCLNGTRLFRYQDTWGVMPTAGTPSVINCGVTAGWTDVFGTLPTPPGLQVVVEPTFANAFLHRFNLASETGVFLHVQVPPSGPQPLVGIQVVFESESQVPNWTP